MGDSTLPTTDAPETPSSASQMSSQEGKGGKLRSTMREDISKDYADIPICLCSLVSGLCDSVAFNSASVFVSMQTGNTIFLALGAASLPANIKGMWLRAICSIAAFWLGVFCWSKLRHVNPLAKGTLAASFFVQAVFIFVAAGLSQGGVVQSIKSLKVAEMLVENQEADFIVLAPIALLAFQFGGQIVTSRQLSFNEVPTNVLTSVYCDLWSDPNLLASWSENPKRNRRAITVVLMTVGGIAGGWLAKSPAGMTTALWIGGFIKLVIAISWLAWKTNGSKQGLII